MNFLQFIINRSVNILSTCLDIFQKWADRSPTETGVSITNIMTIVKLTKLSNTARFQTTLFLNQYRKFNHVFCIYFFTVKWAIPFET